MNSQPNMNAFEKGFIKRAGEYGLTPKQANPLLGLANRGMHGIQNLWQQYQGARSMPQASPLGQGQPGLGMQPGSVPQAPAAPQAPQVPQLQGMAMQPKMGPQQMTPQPMGGAGMRGQMAASPTGQGAGGMFNKPGVR